MIVCAVASRSILASALQIGVVFFGAQMTFVGGLCFEVMHLRLSRGLWTIPFLLLQRTRQRVVLKLLRFVNTLRSIACSDLDLLKGSRICSHDDRQKNFAVSSQLVTVQSGCLQHLSCLETARCAASIPASLSSAGRNDRSPLFPNRGNGRGLEGRCARRNRFATRWRVWRDGGVARQPAHGHGARGEALFLLHR